MTFNSYLGGFAYQYSLVIDGKPYKTFLDQQSKIMKTWILPVDGEMCRVVLEKDTLDIWVNGKKVEVAAEFTDDGKVIPCPFHCGLIIFRILPFPFYSSQNVLCQPRFLEPTQKFDCI